MLIEKRVTELLDAFSSPDPTPGGGSAAALAGAVGASLLIMVAGLPKTKNNTPEERAALDAALATLKPLRQSLTELVDRDTDAYNLVVAAFRNPKNTPDEKAARTAAIQQAMQVATEVPLETLEACCKVMATAGVVAEAGNPSAKSDLAVALQLTSSGLQGALLNIEVNLESVKDAAFIERVVQRSTTAYKASTAGGRHAFLAAGISDLMQKAMARLGAPGHGH